ncbi:MAG TPA: hypothetical protein VEH84_05310 [Alphaproteobacteria bacterium]|nr:hypothetical protein [Alphaproteobacteria bacterium]
MSVANRWLYGAVAVIVGLYGLYMEAHEPGSMRNVGMMLFLGAVFAVGWLIRNHFDEIDGGNTPDSRH